MSLAKVLDTIHKIIQVSGSILVIQKSRCYRETRRTLISLSFTIHDLEYDTYLKRKKSIKDSQEVHSFGEGP